MVPLDVLIGPCPAISRPAILCRSILVVLIFMSVIFSEPRIFMVQTESLNMPKSRMAFARHWRPVLRPGSIQCVCPGDEYMDKCHRTSNQSIQ